MGLSDDRAAAHAPADSAEEVLLERLRAGDAASFETLVRTYGPRLMATAQRILGNEEDARDAVQDGFLSAFRSLAAFEGKSRLSTWLHQIVINASLMRLRTRRRRPEESIETLLPKFMEDGHQAQAASEWTERPDTLLEREETRAFVQRSISDLPESYRTVVLLRDIEELDTEQTARMLGVTPSVVKTRLHRARQALRTLLDARFRGTGP